MIAGAGCSCFADRMPIPPPWPPAAHRTRASLAAILRDFATLDSLPAEEPLAG